MRNGSGYLFGATIFFAVVVLGTELSEWWKNVSLVLVVLAAVVFLTRSVVEYRRVHRVVEASEQKLSR